MSIVQSVTDAVSSDGGAVDAVSVRVGAMSGVIPEALTFAWGAASSGTALAQARLDIEWVPAVVWCDTCEAQRELPGMRMVCPTCQTRCPRLVRGRELDILSVEMAGSPA